MSINALLTEIQNSAIAHAISKSDHLVGAALQIVHVFGLILLLTAQVLITLRLLNLIFKQQPLPDITKTALRIFWLGLGIAALSGALMFIATPKLYYFKWIFQLKILLFAASLIIQVTVVRYALRNPSATLAKYSVAASLLLWFGVGMAGRIIGFV